MIETTQVMDGVFVLMDRAGSCSDLVIGKHEALLFDTCTGVDDLYGAVRKLTDLPLRVLNSHGHFDHIGGNAQFDRASLHPEDMPILNRYSSDQLAAWRRTLACMGEEEVPIVPAGKWGNTVPLDYESFDLGGLPCRIVPLKGHTRGSVGVLVPSLRLLLAGDALSPIMLLIFANHMSREDQRQTIIQAMDLEFEKFLTGHDRRLLDKKLLSSMLRCIMNSETKKGYHYDYPHPPYGKGSLYLEPTAEGVTALIYKENR